MLRVGVSLDRAAMPNEARHPAILAKEIHLCTLILHHMHQATGHGGRNYMLSWLCQKYWISGACVAIRKLRSKCVVCRCLNEAPGSQYMADLPHEFLLISHLSFKLGMDCYGALEIRCDIIEYSIIV